MLLENEREVKKIEFLNAVIKEKTERVKAIKKDLAVFRKKNGKELDKDLYIYQANVRISSEEKGIERCKKELKVIKEKAGEEIIDLYAEETGYKERVKLRERFNKLYEGKQDIVDETESEELSAEFGVATKDKRLNGKVALLLRAGIKTSTGRLIKKPKVGIYEYSKKLTEGEKIVEGYPKDITTAEKKESFIKRLFGAKK